MRVNNRSLAKVAADLQRFHPPLPPRPRRGDARRKSENPLNSLAKFQASVSGSAGAATAFGRDPDSLLRRFLMSQSLWRARLPVQMASRWHRPRKDWSNGTGRTSHSFRCSNPISNRKIESQRTKDSCALQNGIRSSSSPPCEIFRVSQDVPQSSKSPWDQGLQPAPPSQRRGRPLPAPELRPVQTHQQFLANWGQLHSEKYTRLYQTGRVLLDGNTVPA
jgi:hypothetical protein